MGAPTGDGMPRLPGLREAAERRRAVVRRLADARQEQGLSQTVVAAQMGTSQSVVARLESGALDMRLSTLQRYAAALGLDLMIELKGVGDGSGMGSVGGVPGGAADSSRSEIP
jgi:ribosome-binding protein aMBF1 (putative translation factor)